MENCERDTEEEDPWNHAVHRGDRLSVHAARFDLEEVRGLLCRVASARLRSTRWRILRAKLILCTIWDSLTGSCSNTAARQSIRQFSDSSVKREFIKLLHDNSAHLISLSWKVECS